VVFMGCERTDGRFQGKPLHIAAVNTTHAIAESIYARTQIVESSSAVLCPPPPFPLERLSVTRGPDGRIAQVRYVLPRHKAANWVGRGRGRKSTRPGANGVVELTPFEFLDRLTDLVPPPRKLRERPTGTRSALTREKRHRRGCGAFRETRSGRPCRFDAAIATPT